MQILGKRIGKTTVIRSRLSGRDYVVQDDLHVSRALVLEAIEALDVRRLRHHAGC